MAKIQCWIYEDFEDNQQKYLGKQIMNNLNFEFGFYLLIFIFLNHNMDPKSQETEQIVISKLQLIAASVESKRIGLNDKNIILWLTTSDVFQRSGKIIKWILNIRNAILKKLSFANNRDQLANAYLSLAITSEILSNGQAEREYKLALSYDQKQPQTNLSLALLLYDQQRYREAVECIGKLRAVTAFKQQHRINIWAILILKVENRICQQLLKTNNSERRITNVQFIRKLLKFKEAFLYHCAEIQSLSQRSYAQLAKLLLFTNRFADSLTLAYKLRNLNQPPTQNIQQSLALLFLKFNKFEESAECAKQGLRINPRNQSIHKWLIVSLILLQEIPKAKVCAMGLINLNKYNSSAYQLMGQILSIQGSNALALEYCKLGVVIQPSETTYSWLALQFSQNSNFAQAQRCYLKSIKIKANEFNYSNLGVLHFQNDAHLNAMLCFFEAISHNFLHIDPYFYLGLCAKRNTFFSLVINRFMDKLKAAHTQDPFLQTNLAVYKFVSNQSHKQMYAFLSNFMEEWKKGGEETLYADIANQIIWLGLPKYIIKESIIFWLIFGVLCRAKEQRIKANQIFVHLISEQASVNGMSLSFAFNSLYESQISKTPKELRPFFLQFIIAEMVQSSPDQALKCFHKSLSYAQGDYEQFYAEFYKMIERDIEQLWPISIVANSIVDRQPLDQTNEEYVGDAMDEHPFLEYQKYTQHLGAMAQIVNALSQQYSSKLSFQEFHLFLAAVKGNHLIEGLEINVKCPQKVYALLFAQIRNDEETLFKHIQNLCTIYSQKGEIRHLRRKVCEAMELYFDRFILNQRVKLIFNHFHPYVITESCHKQFAVILRRIKECPQYFYYSTWELMEDLKNMFREGNKHTNKVFKVGQSERTEDYSSNTTEIGRLLIDLKSKANKESESSFCANEEDSNISENSDSNNVSIYEGKESQFTDLEETEQITNIQINRFRRTMNPFKYQLTTQASEQKQQQRSYYSEPQQSMIRSLSSETNSSKSIEQTEWHNLHYFFNKNQFLDRRLYSRFSELLYLNTFFLIRYLSKQQNIRYIARHSCENNPPLSRQSFTAKVERGEVGGTQMAALRWVQRLGPIHVIRWITDVALGISELQFLGIYHADLFFRNTIKVTANKDFRFKIIDFDKAFKVNQTKKKDKCFQCTKDLLGFWLKFRFDADNPRAPLWRYEPHQTSSNQTDTDYSEMDIIKYMFHGADQCLLGQLLSIKRKSIFLPKINECVKLLREHMKVSHLKQYSKLVEQLLSDNQLQNQSESRGEFFDPEATRTILEELQQLKRGELSYVSFAKRVRAIGKLSEQSGSEEDGSQE